MKNLTLKSLVLLSLAVVILLAGCSSLPNLADVKSKYRHYHDSGKYDDDIRDVIARATYYCVKRSSDGATNLAIVLDIDDTALSNWSYISDDDFGFEREQYRAWVEKGDAAPVASVLQFYQRVQQLKLSIFFISGRRESLRAATEKNLKSVGFIEWKKVYLRPVDDTHKDIATFKMDIRQKIQSLGYVIIANIGDQKVDFIGGKAERNYKLPNPFYHSD